MNNLEARRKKLDKRSVANRVCGGCTACCTVLGIPELKKPPQQTCKHECAIGCAIYKGRPQSCENYSCLWLSGNIIDQELRPDRCGIIFELNQQLQEIVGFEIWVSRELYDGAFDSATGKAILKHTSSFTALYCIYRTEQRKIILPRRLSHLTEKIVELIQLAELKHKD